MAKEDSMKKILNFALEKPLRFLMVIFAVLVVKELIYITTFRKDIVSPIADGYSEANTIRGGTGFIEKGITSMKGLPDTCYNNLIPTEGRIGFARSKTGDPNASCAGVAYIHYPPGPEYMAWLGMNIVGKENYTLLRLLPITLSVFVGMFFIQTMFNLVGGGTRGLIFGLALLLPPMYTNYMHGLHHQQYAFLMFQLQMCLTILYMTKAEWKKWWMIPLFALLGFCQGYMTFDFAFLATLFVIPFYFYFREDRKVSVFTLIKIGLASGLSFTLAHLLHFYQVVLYIGTYDQALRDFLASANHRASNAGDIANTPHSKYDPTQIGPLTVAKDYLWRVAGRGKYLAINLINFIWIVVGLRFIKRIELKKGQVFHFEIRNSDLLALVSSVVISSLWSIAMKQHAHIHGFIARHYFFCYLFTCLILVTRTRKEKMHAAL
jgi:hypothetical protein